MSLLRVEIPDDAYDQIDFPEDEFDGDDVKEAKSEPEAASPEGGDAVTTSESAPEDGGGKEGNSEGYAKHPQSIPYDRFKEVIEAKNEMKAEADRLRAEIESLRKRSEPTYQQDPDEYDDVLDNSVEARLARMELRHATEMLEREIADIRAKHPDVPEAALLQAAASDPEADLEVVAQNYSSFVGSIREQAVKDYLAKNAAQTPASAEPPVATPPPAIKATGAPVRKVEAPKNLQDAHAAAKKALRDMWKD